jgi:hypothetical protein
MWTQRNLNNFSSALKSEEKVIFFCSERSSFFTSSRIEIIISFFDEKCRKRAPSVTPILEAKFLIESLPIPSVDIISNTAFLICCFLDSVSDLSDAI